MLVYASGSVHAVTGRSLSLTVVNNHHPALLIPAPRAPVSVPQVTVQDQQAWKIPPCVSNWKNARGYTIPLDKRLAADGR